MKAENFLEHTKQAWKKQYLILAFVMLFIALIFTLVSLDSITSVFATPEFKTYDELLVASELDSKGYFQTNVVYEDIYYFDTAYFDENDNVERYYAALIDADGNFTLAEIPAEIAEDESITNFVGHFVELPSDLYDYISEELVEIGFTETEAISAMPLNVYQVTNDKTEGYIFLAIIFVFVIVAIYFIFKMIQASNGSLLSKRLSKMGDVDRYILDLERTPVSSTHPNLAISGSHFILLSGKQIKFISIRNVVWAYEFVKKKKAYFLVTVSKQHHLVIVDHDTKHFSPMKKDEVQQSLLLINKTLPGAIIGYSKEIDKMYKNSKEAFINSVSTQKESINVDESFDLEGKY